MSSRPATLVSPSPLVRALMQRADQAGLTQVQLCRALGLSSRTLSYLLSGKRSVGRRSIKQILRLYPELAALVASEYID